MDDQVLQSAWFIHVLHYKMGAEVIALHLLMITLTHQFN